MGPPRSELAPAIALYQGTALAVPRQCLELAGFSPCRLLFCQIGEAVGKLLRRIRQARLHRVLRPMLVFVVTKNVREVLRIWLGLAWRAGLAIIRG